jgi:hypothetical protein
MDHPGSFPLQAGPDVARRDLSGQATSRNCLGSQAKGYLDGDERQPVARPKADLSRTPISTSGPAGGHGCQSTHMYSGV